MTDVIDVMTLKTILTWTETKNEGKVLVKPSRIKDAIFCWR